MRNKKMKSPLVQRTNHSSSFKIFASVEETILYPCLYEMAMHMYIFHGKYITKSRVGHEFCYLADQALLFYYARSHIEQN